MVVKLKLFARKPELHLPALVWFLSSCVADILITVFLVISLVRFYIWSAVLTQSVIGVTYSQDDGQVLLLLMMLSPS
jgi:hypothetical protein